MKIHGCINRDRRTWLKVAGAVAGVFIVGGVPLAAPSGARLKIGVIGSGRIGGTLGGVWAKAGHEVMFSSRNIENDRKLAADVGPRARAGTPREAAAFGDVVLIAVPYRALPEVARDVGPLLKGKVVIDPNNPFPSRDGEIATWAREKGAGLATAELLPGARLVRTFNAIGYASMGAAHQQQGRRIGMPMASDDAAAVEVVSRLVRDIGYEPVLVGPLAMGRHLMPGTPLAGEHAPDDIRRIAATLQ